MRHHGGPRLEVVEGLLEPDQIKSLGLEFEQRRGGKIEIEIAA